MVEPHSEHQPAGGRTSAQNRALWRRVHELDALHGAGNGELLMRRIVREISGADCTRRLTAEQMRRVLDALTLEVRRVQRAQRAPEPAEPPTAAQQQTVEAYRHVLGIGTQGLQKLCRRVNGELHPWPQTRAEAIKLLEALKGMFGRKLRRETGFARSLELRLEALAESAALTDWERRFVQNVIGRLRAGLVPAPGAVDKIAEIDRTRRPTKEGVHG